MQTKRLWPNDPEQTAKPVALITVVLVLTLAAGVAALVLFAWIAEEMLEGETARFDTTVRTWVHGFASPGLTSTMLGITEMGSLGLGILAGVSFVFFFIKGWKRAAVWILLSLAGATVLSLTLKNAFHRTRPVPFFAPLPHSYSFPSGHALFSFCFYGVLAGLIAARVRSLWLRIVVWTLAATLVLAIGVSRIYLGVHYPSDVVAGYLAALFWASSLVVADRIRKTRRGLKVATVSDPDADGTLSI